MHKFLVVIIEHVISLTSIRRSGLAVFVNTHYHVAAW